MPPSPGTLGGRTPGRGKPGAAASGTPASTASGRRGRWCRCPRGRGRGRRRCRRTRTRPELDAIRRRLGLRTPCQPQLLAMDCCPVGKSFKKGAQSGWIYLEVVEVHVPQERVQPTCPSFTEKPDCHPGYALNGRHQHLGISKVFSLLAKVGS